MDKNNNSKNIYYSTFEIISTFILLTLTLFMYSGPKRIISICGNSGLLGILLITIVTYIVYRIIFKNVYTKEFDFFEVIKGAFSLSIQKIIGIILFLFCMVFTYMIIHYANLNIQNTDYKSSNSFSIYVYYIVALFFVFRHGFDELFKLFGYLSIFVILYILITFAFMLPHLSVYNLFPIFGSSKRSLLLTNFQNIDLFVPLIFILFFNMKIRSKLDDRKNIKNSKLILNRIVFITCILFLIITYMFLGSIPVELLNDNLLFFYSQPGLILPINIWLYSLLTFLTAGFISLAGCYALERLHLVENKKKTSNVYLILLAIMLILPKTLINFKLFEQYFSYASIFLAFIFPLFTILIYKIKGVTKNEK